MKMKERKVDGQDGGADGGGGGQWAVVSDQWSVVSGQWSAVSRVESMEKLHSVGVVNKKEVS